MTNNSDFDLLYGALRSSTHTDVWETRPPSSLQKLNERLAEAMNAIEQAAQNNLFANALQTITLIWAMDYQSNIWIAVEELALRQSLAEFDGYPRRRGFRHPAQQEKLGHPTLLRHVDPDTARIAGELFLDRGPDAVGWVINGASGRYCRIKPPTENQLNAVADLFQNFGVKLVVDKDG